MKLSAQQNSGIFFCHLIFYKSQPSCACHLACLTEDFRAPLPVTLTSNPCDDGKRCRGGRVTYWGCWRSEIWRLPGSPNELSQQNEVGWGQMGSECSLYSQGPPTALAGEAEQYEREAGGSLCERSQFICKWDNASVTLNAVMGCVLYNLQVTHWRGCERVFLS